MKPKLYPKIKEVIKNLDISEITEKRQEILRSLIDYIQAKKDAGQPINLNFICTHNSRRSHLSQVWAQTMAAYFTIDNVLCFSGGTEVTALFPKVIETFINSGFQISEWIGENNPVYTIRYAENKPPIKGFSKIYDDTLNPKSDFAAVMTCSHADENCPFIPGTEKRIPITYNDPKAFDNTPQQTEKYLERSSQIATEMYYVFSLIQ